MDNFTKEFVDGEIAYMEELGIGADPQNPYVVPPFDGKTKKPIERYFWWGWHPCYPYWSKSCWGGVTQEEAMKVVERPESGMDVYHCKLIREDENGVLVEVADRPCKRLDIWRNIAAKSKATAG